MLSRILVILLFVPLLIYILLLGELSFLAFVMVIISISLFEFYRILIKKNNIVYFKTGMVLSLMLPIFLYFKNDLGKIFVYFNLINNKEISFDMGTFIVFSTIFIAVMQITKEKIKNSTNEITLTLFGIIYVSFFLSHILIMREDLYNGRIFVLFIFISIWACDTFAYLVGILIGGVVIKKRLSEKISPKKSIEGVIGGILGVFLVAYFFDDIFYILIKMMNILRLVDYDLYINKVFISNNIVKLLILSILIGIFSVLGDLFESKFKREYFVKDSGSILLGHGGFLDRFDSALFVFPIVYYYIKYFII